MSLVALFKQIKEQKALNSLTLGWQSVPSLSWPQGQLCGTLLPFAALCTTVWF